MKFPPISMNIYERNKRLYEFLISMGHIVSPILVEGTENIQHMYVTVGSFFDHSSQNTETSISSSFQGLPITENISSTKASGDVVVDFPRKS